MGCVLLINFGASLLKLPKHRGLTLTEWVWVINPKPSQALSLREAPDMPRVAEALPGRAGGYNGSTVKDFPNEHCRAEQ